MSGGRRRLRNVLVVTELALALVLLTGAGLLARSFIVLLRVNPGFDTERALTLETMIGRGRTPEQIWEDPTQAEWDHVCMAVENYVASGAFRAEADGRYPWGGETVTLA